MNNQLNQIFKIILPELEKNNIKHWIFGGVAIAGIKGGYLRNNNDIDSFVLEKDYKKAEKVLEYLCEGNPNWIARLYTPEAGKRPKIEICEKNNPDKDIFSLIPVFEINKEIEFIFPGGNRYLFSREILKLTERKLKRFKFYTSPGWYVKDLFKRYLLYLLKAPNKGKEWIKNRYKEDIDYLGLNHIIS